MRRLAALFLTLVLNLHCGLQMGVAAKTLQQSQGEVSPLNNEDILKLVRSGIATEVIIAKLEKSGCVCEISTTEFRRLKAEGVADELLFAMINANKVSARIELQRIEIPKNTTVEIEAAYRISSQEVKTGEAISFRVVTPVQINGVIVIDSGAIATGRVTKASRGGHFGKAGRLAWLMEDVAAVDGSKVPLETTGRIVGDSKGATVATQMAITGTLLWPIAPVALLHGFKRGGNAYLAQGRRYQASVSADTTIRARSR